ncbi:uncharacterized, partial [Tachysurus ichikawai]
IWRSAQLSARSLALNLQEALCLLALPSSHPGKEEEKREKGRREK